MGTLKAEVIAYSSIVGGGVMLMNEKNQMVGHLALLHYDGPINPITPENVATAKKVYMETCETVAAAINAGQPERQLKHYKKDTVYDVVAEKALFQVSSPNSTTRVVQDGEEVVVYRNPDGMHFVRFPDEVVEPRFTEVKS